MELGGGVDVAEEVLAKAAARIGDVKFRHLSLRSTEVRTPLNTLECLRMAAHLPGPCTLTPASSASTSRGLHRTVFLRSGGLLLFLVALSWCRCRCVGGCGDCGGGGGGCGDCGGGGGDGGVGGGGGGGCVVVVVMVVVTVCEVGAGWHCASG